MVKLGKGQADTSAGPSWVCSMGGGVLPNSENRMRILRRHALEIAAQLPEDIHDALTILAIARSALEHVDAIVSANDDGEQPRRLKLRV